MSIRDTTVHQKETVMLTTNSHLEVKLVHERTSTCDSLLIFGRKNYQIGFSRFPSGANTVHHVLQFSTAYHSQDTKYNGRTPHGWVRSKALTRILHPLLVKA